MNIKSEKGITGVDISVSIIIILLFVSLTSTLVYNYAKNSKEVQRKSIATDMIIDILEYSKSSNYDDLTNEYVQNYIANNEKFQKNGYKVSTTIENYLATSGEESKKVTATVQYLVNKTEQKLEIYTIIKDTNITNNIIWNTND